MSLQFKLLSSVSLIVTVRLYLQSCIRRLTLTSVLMGGCMLIVFLLGAVFICYIA